LRGDLYAADLRVGRQGASGGARTSLVIAELDVDAAWVGVYYGVSAAASLVARMGCGSCIVRYGALRMSQGALLWHGLGSSWGWSAPY
jgi:hypothetical protein